MVIACVAYGCKNTQKCSDSSVSFHRFPHKRPEVLKRWVKAIWRDQWQPTKFSRLCSDHFTDDSYQVRPGAEYRLLKDNAVPTLFNIPAHVVKKIPSYANLIHPASVKQSASKNNEDNNEKEGNKTKNIQLKIVSKENYDLAASQKVDSQLESNERRTPKSDKVENKTLDSFTINCLKRKIRVLQKKLAERDKVIKTLYLTLRLEKKKQLCECYKISKV